jgi:hypothetical protein
MLPHPRNCTRIERKSGRSCFGLSLVTLLPVGSRVWLRVCFTPLLPGGSNVCLVVGTFPPVGGRVWFDSSQR